MLLLRRAQYAQTKSTGQLVDPHQTDNWGAEGATTHAVHMVCIVRRWDATEYVTPFDAKGWTFLVNYTTQNLAIFDDRRCALLPFTRH